MKKSIIKINNHAILFLLYFIFSLSTTTAQYLNIDSVETLLKTSITDDNRIALLNQLATEYNNTTPSRALQLSNEALELSIKTNNTKGEVNSLLNLGNYYLLQSEQETAFKYYTEALQKAENYKDKKLLATAYHNLGKFYYGTNRFSDIKKSMEHYKMAMKLWDQIDDKQGLANTLNNMSIICNAQKDYTSAIDFQSRALKLYEQINDKSGVAASANNIGLVYMNLGLLDNAQASFDKAYTIALKMNDKVGISITLLNIGDVYKNKNIIDSAISKYNQAYLTASEINYLDNMATACQFMAETYAQSRNYKEAYKFSNLWSDLKDSLVTEAGLKSIAELQTSAENEKRKEQIELLNKDKTIRELAIIKKNEEINKRELITIISGTILLIISILVFFIYRGFKQKEAANKLLESANTELEQKNLLITDSIDYAQKIQAALLPAEEHIQTTYPNSFIMSKPRSIVSGDFCWISKEDSLFSIAVADCTGHGVSGAFMTLVGYNLLQNITKSNKGILNHPSQVLSKVNKALLHLFPLNYQEYTAKTSMDISLVTIHPTNSSICFSGTHNKMFLIRSGELIELEGNRIHLGIKQATEQTFQEKTITFQKNDWLYLFSDGYINQIGEESREKFYNQPFKELLIAASKLTIQAQKELLETTWKQWAGTNDQTDDLLLIGIQL